MNVIYDASKVEWYRPSDRLVFVLNDLEVGALDWHDGILKFTGNADTSAHVLFEHILKSQIDEYIEANLHGNKT